MILIKIEKSSTQKDIDNYYLRLDRVLEVDGETSLLLPKQLDHDSFGLVPAIIQFIITWSRSPHPRAIRLNISNPEKEDFNGMIQDNELLFAAYSLCWHQSDFLNEDGSVDIRQYLRQGLLIFRNAVVKANPIKGNKLLLLAIDHFPIASGRIPAFDNDGEFIDNPANTASNLKPAFDQILSYSQETKNWFNLYRVEFFRIIHELMKNTYQWAKTDELNIPISPSIRGLHVRFFKKTRNALVAENRENKNIQEYFKSLSHIENSKKELYFIEISVFDSGIGFVSRYDGPNKDNLDDIQIIKACLIKHMTSAKGLDKDDKGVGLDYVLKTINKKGLLRIRTNKRCLYRNMITHPYTEVSNPNEMELFDWGTEKPTDFKELPNALGSAISILYPLAINLSK